MVFVAEASVMRWSFDIVEEAGSLFTDSASIVVFVLGLETKTIVSNR